MKRAETLAAELERRGIGGPAAILMDAHRPFAALRQGAIFLVRSTRSWSAAWRAARALEIRDLRPSLQAGRRAPGRTP